MIVLTNLMKLTAISVQCPVCTPYQQWKLLFSSVFSDLGSPLLG